ncbi:MAG: PIN domain-containing protein [Chloroflexia bacterium]
MTTAVDTNVLLDVLAGDERASTAASQSLVEAGSIGPLVICPVVYSELAAAFERRLVLEGFLGDVSVRVEPFSEGALWLSGSAWRTYTRRRGRGIRRPRCGNQFQPNCPACGAAVSWRRHIISDFLIGGHALEQANVLLTRDRGYYRNYLPSLRLQIPETTRLS